MRIIAGTFRSRTLQAPPGLSTRPTSDRLRETLFNVLAPRIRGAHFLDLFAGSGAVGLEALSRGAAHVTFVERAPAAIKTLRANLAQLQIESGCTIKQASVAETLRKPTEKKFDVVFLDPPYEAADDYTAALGTLGGASLRLLAPGAIVIAEHRRKQPLDICFGKLERSRLLEQGDAALSFYRVVESATAANQPGEANE